MPGSQLFLQLSEEFGGTKFGPFEGAEIRLGSDPGGNDITLPESLGVLPQHVRVIKQSEDAFIVAPVERTAAIFIWRRTSSKPKQITTPMAVSAGDGFSLVTPEGPRFYLITEQPKSAAKSAAAGASNIPAPSGGALLDEVKRRGFAAIFASSIGNMAGNAWRMVSTGQIFSPFYIITALTMASGWVMAGGAACTAVNFSFGKADAQQQLMTCKDQLQGTTDDGKGPTVGSLTNNLLEDSTWQTALTGDTAIYQAYANELKTVFQDLDRYRWAYSRGGGDLAKFKKALDSQGLPPGLVRVFAYGAAEPRLGAAQEWGIVEDSEESEVCGRGPLRMTYRQAYTLGMDSVQLDALVPASVAESSDIEQKKAALSLTASNASAEIEFEDSQILTVGARVQGGDECIFLDGEDSRVDIDAIATKVKQVAGSSARDLPREGEPYWVAARLVKWYTGDFRRGYSELKFDARKAPSVQMELSQIATKRGKYASKMAGKAMARAIAVPCFAVLDKENDAFPSFLGQEPQLSQCALIKAFVEYDRL